jgi:hypothetical protein
MAPYGFKGMKRFARDVSRDWRGARSTTKGASMSTETPSRSSPSTARSKPSALAGRIDAIACAGDRAEVVVDWKSDVDPSDADIRLHTDQLEDYLRATGAPRSSRPSTSSSSAVNGPPLKSSCEHPVSA